MKTFKNYVKQPSTWRGLALLGSSAVAYMATGNAEVLGIQLNESGLQLGGLATLAIGLWETLRNQNK